MSEIDVKSEHRAQLEHGTSSHGVKRSRERKQTETTVSVSGTNTDPRQSADVLQTQSTRSTAALSTKMHQIANQPPKQSRSRSESCATIKSSAKQAAASNSSTTSSRSDQTPSANTYSGSTSGQLCFLEQSSVRQRKRTARISAARPALRVVDANRIICRPRHPSDHRAKRNMGDRLLESAKAQPAAVLAMSEHDPSEDDPLACSEVLPRRNRRHAKGSVRIASSARRESLEHSVQHSASGKRNAGTSRPRSGSRPSGSGRLLVDLPTRRAAPTKGRARKIKSVRHSSFDTDNEIDIDDLINNITTLRERKTSSLTKTS